MMTIIVSVMSAPQRYVVPRRNLPLGHLICGLGPVRQQSLSQVQVKICHHL